MNRLQKTIQQIISRKQGRGRGQKTSPFAWPTTYNGVVQWSMGNFQEYVESGFELNSIIYSAIMYKVRAGSQAKLVAWTGPESEREMVSPTHPLNTLAIRPNPHQSWTTLHGQLITFLNLSGNAYIYLHRNTTNGPVLGMYILRPDYVYIIPGGSALQGYLYKPHQRVVEDAIPLLPDDVIHLKFPNPGDIFEGHGYGLSPLAPLAQSGDVDNDVTKFLKLFFDRGAMMPGLLKYDIPLDETEIGGIKGRWRDIYGGVENWADIGVLDSGASYQQMGLSFNEMGFDGIDERNESRILGPFGVPPILIGTRFGLQRSTYSNYAEARRAFWEDTMAYELALQEAEFQYSLSSPDGAYLAYDTSTVPGLRQDVQQLADTAHKLFLMGVPSAQAFATVGLDVAANEVSERSFVPRTLVEYDKEGAVVSGVLPTSQLDQVDQVGAGTLDQDELQEADGTDGTEETEETDETDKATHPKGPDQIDRKARIRYAQTKTIQTIAETDESKYITSSRVAFGADHSAVSAIVTKAQQKAIQSKATIDWSAPVGDVESYYANAGQENWRSTFVPRMAGTMETASGYWSVQLGMEFDIRNIRGEAWFQKYTLEFAQTITDTSMATMHTVFSQAMAEGWTIGQMQNNLQTMFGQWAEGALTAEDFKWYTDRMPPYRAEMIARTETIRAANAGSLHQYKEWGVGEKEWSSTGDTRTRETHRNANGQVRQVDKPFSVGGYSMAHPGDASLGAPPEEFVNCRCAVLPIIE